MKKGLLVFFWVIGGIFVLLVAFAILQPFLWRLIFNEKPAEITITYSNLLSIMIALLALGIGSLSGMSYYLISRRIQDETRKAARQEYILTITKHHSSICFLWGSLYETLMRLLEPKKQNWCNHCIVFSLVNGKKAMEFIKELDKNLHKDLIFEANNNYAMALALRGDPGTGKIAEGLINDLEKSKKEYLEEDKKRYALEETINFLRWRIPRKPNDCQLAVNNLKTILNSPFYKDKPRAEFIRQRWKQFSKPKV